MDSAVADLVKNFSSGARGDFLYAFVEGDNLRQFGVSGERAGVFLQSICDLIEENMADQNEDPIECGHTIVEIIKDKRAIPVQAHFKFAFDPKSLAKTKVSCRDPAFVSHVVETLQSCLTKKLSIQDKHKLDAIVEISKPFEYGPVVNVEMRVIFPYCQVETSLLRTKLRKKFIEVFREEGVFHVLKPQPTNVVDSIFQVLENFIPLSYGKTDYNSYPMEFYGYYHDEGQVDDINESSLDPRQYSLVQTNVFSDHIFEQEKELQYWLPFLTSIYFEGSETKEGEGDSDDEEEEQKMQEPEDEIEEFKEDVCEDDPATMAKYLLSMIKDSYSNKSSFSEICRVIYNIFGKGREGISMICKYSKFDKSYVEKTMSEFHHKNHLTVRTLAAFARKDSPRRYVEWHKNWFKNALLSAIGSVKLDDVLAEIAYRMFWTDFVYDPANDVWYSFNGVALEEDHGSIDFKKKIRDQLVNIYVNLEKKYKQEASKPGVTDEKKKQYDSACVEINKLVAALSTDACKKRIIKSSEINFSCKFFSKIKDRDFTKTAWVNCVVHCHENEAIVVDGKIEDYITKNTKIPYCKEYSIDHPDVKEMLSNLRKIFPDEELLHYSLKEIASFLYGKNAEKLFRIYCGEGNNGKSILFKLYHAFLGDYCFDFDPEVLTSRKKSSSGPSPEIAMAADANVGLIPETDEEAKFKESSVKRLTGGDHVYARLLHSNGGSVEMKCKIIAACNLIPKFNRNSQAIYNRFLYIPFIATFCDDAPETDEEQYAQKRFKNDKYFDQKIQKLALAMGWLAVHYYSVYKTEGMNRPPIVKKYTDEYWAENDDTSRFIHECLEITTDANGEYSKGVSTVDSQIYPIFQKFFRTFYPGTDIPGIDAMTAALNQRLGKPEMHQRFGVSLKAA